MATGADDRWTGDAPADLARLGRAMRALQDGVASTKAPPEVAAEAAAALERAAALLDPYKYDVATDRSWDDIGRGAGTRTIGPVLTDVVNDGERLEATVRFTPFYLGGNGAAHGGTLPLLFDEAFARLVNLGRERSRTAYLRVDYRRVTLLGRAITVEAHVERVDGRKRYVAGSLRDGDVVTAEGTALYVELKPGSA
jgi:acyl-coenzyme A thioesterase PaaI-like protein